MNNYLCSNRFCQAPPPPTLFPLFHTPHPLPTLTPTHPTSLSYPFPPHPHPHPPPTTSHPHPFLSSFFLSSIYISNILTMSHISQFFAGLISTFSCAQDSLRHTTSRQSSFFKIFYSRQRFEQSTFGLRGLRLSPLGHADMHQSVPLLTISIEQRSFSSGYEKRFYFAYLYSGHPNEVTPKTEFSSYILPCTRPNGIVAFDKTMVQAWMPVDISIAGSGLTYTLGM